MAKKRLVALLDGDRTPVLTSLQVERHQVEARERDILVLEQMVGDLLGDELVQSLHGGGGQATDHLVNHTRLVQRVRVEERVLQLRTTEKAVIIIHIACQMQTLSRIS